MAIRDGACNYVYFLFLLNYLKQVLFFILFSKKNLETLY
jgi:hypothetical protein